MDPFDAFYQELDSKRVLDEHAASLLDDAREMLAAHPKAKVAAMILFPDSPEAPTIRAAMAQVLGQAVPEGLSAMICPRRMVEALLTSQVRAEQWREEAWQDQQVLPVVVSTRDGFRFGFFPLAR